MTEEFTISSAVSKMVYEYLRDEYNLGTGLYYTSRKLYTVYDIPFVEREKLPIVCNFTNKLSKKRFNNFAYVNSLKAFNSFLIFDKIAEEVSCKENGLIIVPSGIIKAILAKIENKNMADYFIDNIAVTIQSFKKEEVEYFIMIADYLTYSII